MTSKITPGICRFCGCTDEFACILPCFWIDKAHTICSSPSCIAKARSLKLLQGISGARMRVRTERRKSATKCVLATLLILFLSSLASAADRPFWSRNTKLAWASVAMLRAADTAATCRLLANCGHENWYPTQRCYGIGLFEAADLGLGISAAYFLHRRQHDWLGSSAPIADSIMPSIGLEHTLSQLVSTKDAISVRGVFPRGGMR